MPYSVHVVKVRDVPIECGFKPNGEKEVINIAKLQIIVSKYIQCSMPYHYLQDRYERESRI